MDDEEDDEKEEEVEEAAARNSGSSLGIVALDRNKPEEDAAPAPAVEMLASADGDANAIGAAVIVVTEDIVLPIKNSMRIRLEWNEIQRLVVDEIKLN